MPGTLVNTLRTKAARQVFDKYPHIHIIAESAGQSITVKLLSGLVQPDESSVELFGERGRFSFSRSALGELEKLSGSETHIRRTRLNDGKFDRQDRFVCGGMDYEERNPLAGLYRPDPDGGQPGPPDRHAGEEGHQREFSGPDLDVLHVTSMANSPLPLFSGDPVLRRALFAIHDPGVGGVSNRASPDRAIRPARRPGSAGRTLYSL